MTGTRAAAPTLPRAVFGWLVLVVCGLLGATALGGCDDPPAADTLDTAELSSIYSAVLTHVQQHSSFNQNAPKVFVKPLSDGQEFPLDVQAEVITALKEHDVTVEFVDSDEAALADDAIRDDGVFVAVGAVVRRQSKATVQFAEIYPGRQTKTWLASFTLVRDVWVVSNDVEAVN